MYLVLKRISLQTSSSSGLISSDELMDTFSARVGTKGSNAIKRAIHKFMNP
jgi:hypothetical protein